MTSPSNTLLFSSAIAYTPPPKKSSSGSATCGKNDEFYWHPDLLHKWQSLLQPNNDGIILSTHHHDKQNSINYASLMVLAVQLADELRRKLSLHRSVLVSVDSISTSKHSLSIPLDETTIRDTTANTLRIGMAIPEGPFLPLFVLVIHSLNIAVAECWLTATVDDDVIEHDDADSSNSNSGTKQTPRGKAVVLIPMETDEAPERLKHIVTDSSPHLILVAPGDDWRSMENALGKQQQQQVTTTTQLVDFIELIEAAFAQIMKRQRDDNVDYYSWIETLCAAPDVSGASIENSSWDVARLVANGCARLASTSGCDDTTSSSLPNYTTSSSSSSSSLSIMSHIVYTSGTTGLPKGCISSLSSLQNYVSAKNIAHEINSQSNVMLASAVTFDPCFSDVLATFLGNGTLCLAPRAMLYGHGDNSDDDGGELDKDGGGNSYRGLTKLLRQLRITHVLCTPTLWAMVEGDPPMNVPTLQVVALGGEPIPKSMRGRWARRRVIDEVDSSSSSTRLVFDRDYPRLFATYGVTEACVYQTCGEVINELQLDSGVVRPGQNVGLPLLGTNVSICRPLSEDDNEEENTKLEMLEQGEESSNPVIGEVALSGKQVDVMSSYLNLPKLTRRVFVQSSGDEGDATDHTFFYRTGDLGYIDKRTGEVYINGRIKGDGMVKINGIRIELSEIEASVIDDIVDDSHGLVIDCMAAVATSASSSTDNDDNQHKQLIAYCILSTSSISQLGIDADRLKAGVIVPQSPLLSLLRARCDRRVRKGCMPSFFVIIERLPLSPTGKRNRLALPAIEKCSIMSLAAGDDSSTSLWEYGVAGPIVAEKICECLNLQSCQKSLVTTSSSFFILGGDSLAATRVTRGLYAHHHNVNDSRNLGGSSGTLDGPFAARFLLQANTLGEYCEFLDSHSAFCGSEQREGNVMRTGVHSGDNKNSKQPDTLFESLIESITMGHANVSMALLDYVDPNIQPIQARLGKVTDRKQQRSLFKSNPLHLACIRGDAVLVRALLDKGWKANTPNSSGAFPIHLACSHLESADNPGLEDLNRRECVRMLLEAGTPIAIKDGNKQTILHSAARSAHVELLKFVLLEWKAASNAPKGIKFKSHGKLGSIYDWHDRWYRTPVHWAILNKRIETLRVLLDGGCSASPPKPKQGVSKRSTSVLIETPMEMCQRLYGDKEGVGKEISTMLQNAE
eukprot:scaffold12335_cov116-Skeletonema_dohrnii-CCMP3373.AAC.2